MRLSHYWDIPAKMWTIKRRQKKANLLGWRIKLYEIMGIGWEKFLYFKYLFKLETF